MNNFILDLITFGAILSGILVITTSNPVISILFLISVFVNVAGYLIVIGIGFIGITYLIVYVGAIAILFLFVVMMLNINTSEIISVGREYSKNLPIAFIVGTLFFFEIINMDIMTSIISVFQYLNDFVLGIDNISNIHMAFNFVDVDNLFSQFIQLETIGYTLYTFGSVWLIISSFILLIGITGPIVLCISIANSKNTYLIYLINIYYFLIFNIFLIL